MSPLLVLALVGAVLAAVADPYRREPQWNSQWHLHDPSEPDEYWLRTGLAVDHLGVQTVWRRLNVTGRGVRLAIVDDGVDVAHPEFASAYDAELAWDYNDQDANPSPRVHDSHGTQSAGVATGHLNGVCGVGTAPGATLVPVRLIASPVTDLAEASGVTHRSDVVDIYSNSWGPADDGQTLGAPGPATLAAMTAAVETGRRGRGVIYVWAGGNGRQWGDMCSYDGFASSRLVIAVAAVSYFDEATYYGEWCPALLVSAPSSSGAGPDDKRRIATTQPHGRFGESDGDCCTDFGGTSAAAPMVAGVVALMLEARPQLGWRDVQHVLAASARRNDPTHPSWHRNAAGRWYSPAYGFGVVNATAAVELAQSWTPLPSARSVAVRTTAEHWTELSDAVLNPGTDFPLELDAVYAGRVEFVELFVTIQHPRRGDLRIVLTSPAGTRSELATPHDDPNADYSRWRFGARNALGEQAAGTWVVHVQDVIPNGNRGAVHELELRVWVTD